jgi:hypothetical protein
MDEYPAESEYIKGRKIRNTLGCTTRKRQLKGVAAARPKALPMVDGQTIGKLALAAATHNLMLALPQFCRALIPYRLCRGDLGWQRRGGYGKIETATG